MNLYPFQEVGADFLVQRDRAYLADEMGLGKTVQAAHAASLCLWDDSEVVVVCPASVVENWKREWEEWATGLRPAHVISYSKLIRPHYRDQLPKYPDLVICDEAHYLKSPSAKRTRAALKYAKSTAGRVWLLSGTPMPNDPTELYAVLKVLWPELLDELGAATKEAFLNRFCVWSQSDWGPRIWGITKAAKEELVPALRRVMLRRKLADVALELPPLRFTIERLPKNAQLADELEALLPCGDPALGLDASVDDTHLATLRRVLGEYKADPIAKKIVEELEEDPRLAMVVMYHHHRTGEVLAERLYAAEIPVSGFDGRTPSEERQAEIDRFQSGDTRVFLAQQGAAGVGITLTRATEIVLVEPSWSPADNEQAVKRIHRIGQEQPCRARLFAVPDSLDEALMAALRRKQGMIREVLP